ncbi:MAG: DUF167 domain-containing protein [Polyangiaceae bacterium]|jgi:uncharacterized protein
MAKVRRSESATKGVVRLTVRVKPRAKTSCVLCADGLSVDLALAAPPVDGAANDELIRTLAKALGVPKRSLRLALGAASRTKVVEVAGLARAEIIARLSAQTRLRRDATRDAHPHLRES